MSSSEALLALAANVSARWSHRRFASSVVREAARNRPFSALRSSSRTTDFRTIARHPTSTSSTSSSMLLSLPTTAGANAASAAALSLPPEPRSPPSAEVATTMTNRRRQPETRDLLILGSSAVPGKVIAASSPPLRPPPHRSCHQQHHQDNRGRRTFSSSSAAAAAAAAAAPPSSSKGNDVGVGATDGAKKEGVTTLESSHEDQTLEGRYAAALFRVAKRGGVLDDVHEELEVLQAAVKESPDFRLFVETPGISSEHKAKFLEYLKASLLPLSRTTMNFLSVLLENRRLRDLELIIAAFDNFYREEKGHIKCTVTSEKELSASERKDITTALQQHAGSAAKLIVTFKTSPSILGGLVVRMGEKVLDFSVATSVDRLQAQLAVPIEQSS